MNSRRAPASTTIPINGEVLRATRMDRGIEVRDLARRAGISRSYLTKLELGISPRCSPTVYAALVRSLKPEAADAFRAKPTRAAS